MNQGAGKPIRILASAAVASALTVMLGAAAAPAPGLQVRPGAVTNDRFQLDAVSVLSDSDAWAVGDSATVLHWNGTNWAPVTIPGLPAIVTLNAVDALSPSDVWAVGKAGLAKPYAPMKTLTVHWDGTAWTRVPNPVP